MKQHGPWKIVSSQLAYADPWVSLRRDEVIRPDSQPGSYCVVHVKPGVCVVAIDDQNRVHLTEEFHYGVARVTIEAVSGGIEPDESAESAAQRELLEELGIVAGHWIDLGTTDPFTANVVSPTRLFLARELSMGPANRDGGEVIRHVVWTLEETLAAVIESRISHAPSALAIFKAYYYLKHKQ